MSDESNSGLGWTFENPQTWDTQVWILIVFTSIFGCFILFEEDRTKWSAGHQVIIGMAIIEVALFAHVIMYPGLVIALVDGITAMVTMLLSLLPTIPWEPWHVTTSMGGLVGPLFILNGLRAGGES